MCRVVCLRIQCGLCFAQFERHGSNLEKTKRKLLEAANLVDKVTFQVKLFHKQTPHLISFKTNECLPVAFPVSVHSDSTTRL